MIRTLLRLRRDERGQSLALIAVMIGGLMGMIALGIDLGSLIAARREAQRAADSAALAGANEFILKSPAAAAVSHAYDSAMAYATRNYIQNTFIDTSEVTIQVIPAEEKVWVRIERQGLGLWFARFLGKNFATVNAAAAAAAMPAGAAQCLAPFAIPDLWHDVDDDTIANNAWDDAEQWVYGDDPGEYYKRYDGDPAAIPPETGYGSTYRNGNGMGITDDYGLPMRLKVQDPSTSPTSGFFYPFRIGTNTGANDYRDAIQSCDDQVVPLGVPVPLEMGNMKGPTGQGVVGAVDQDSAAYWDTSTNTVVGSMYGAGWLNSSRVKIVPLYSPDQIALIVGGNHNVTFNNFALIWLDGMASAGQDEYVLGRFLYFATGLGTGPGTTTGSLARVLQLIE
ncbi:MAG: pilus assembly protein TadG-related protein [Longimicrobiales bacterium]